MGGRSGRTHLDPLPGMDDRSSGGRGGRCTPHTPALCDEKRATIGLSPKSLSVVGLVAIPCSTAGLGLFIFVAQRPLCYPRPRAPRASVGGDTSAMSAVHKYKEEQK